jgi:hypothetical protein
MSDKYDQFINSMLGEKPESIDDYIDSQLNRDEYDSFIDQQLNPIRAEKELSGPMRLPDTLNLTGQDPDRPELWQELHIPWWKKVLNYATLGHTPAAETRQPDPGEVTYYPEGDERILEPRTATPQIDEDIGGLPVMAFGAGAMAARGMSIPMRIMKGATEAAGEVTGGISDIPRVVAPVSKAVPKVVSKAKQIQTDVARKQFTKKFLGVGEKPKIAKNIIETSFDKEKRRLDIRGLIDLDPRTPEFKKLSELYNKQGEEALSQYRKIYPTGPIVLSKKQDGILRGVIISKNTKPSRKKYPFQYTWWDKKGFSGDEAFKTEAEAVKQAFIEGIKKPDIESFKKISKSDEFLEGVESSLEIQKFNLKGIKKPKAEKFDDFVKKLEAESKIEVEEFTEEQFGNAFAIMKEEAAAGKYGRGNWFKEGGWSQKEFDALMKNIDIGRPLTKKQMARYVDLKAVAEDYLRTQPDLMTEADFLGSTKLYSGLPLHELGKAGKAWTKYVGEPVWDKFIMEKVPKMLEKIPGGKRINRATLYDYRGDLPKTEKYLASMEDMRRAQSIGREYAVDLGKRLQAYDEATQIKMGMYISGDTADIQKAAKATLGKRELAVADEAKRSMLDLGKQAVDVGLLDEKTFFKNAGRYMPRLYTSKEYKDLLTTFNLKKPSRLDLGRFKMRKDIPKEIRKAMGEILTPGYPIAKGIGQLTHDISMSRHFNGIAANPDWAWSKAVDPAISKQVRKYINERKKFIKKGQLDYESVVKSAQEKFKDINITAFTDEAGKRQLKIENAKAIPDGWKQIEGKKLGALNGAYVHPEIFDDLSEAIRVMTKPEKYWRKSLGSWKFGKVILSPKTHARNLMSNSVLAHLGGMPMPMQPISGQSCKADEKQGRTLDKDKGTGRPGPYLDIGRIKAVI